MLKIVERVLEPAWRAFPESIRLNPPSKIDDAPSSSGFEATKIGDAMHIATEQAVHAIPRQYFAIALDYLIRHGHTRETPCEIRSSFTAPGPLNVATQVNHRVTIMYILPILHRMGLVGIGSARPATTWLAADDDPMLERTHER